MDALGDHDFRVAIEETSRSKVAAGIRAGEAADLGASQFFVICAIM